MKVFLLLFITVSAFAQNYATNVEINDNICSDGAKFGLSKCSGTDGVITKLKNQLKDDAKLALFLVSKKQNVPLFDPEVGICLVHEKNNPNTILNIGKVCDSSKSERCGNYCSSTASDSCSTEGAWIKGLRLRAIKYSYEKIINEINSKNINASSCAPIAESIKKLLNGDLAENKHGITQTRETLISKYSDLKNALKYSELTKKCDGSESYKLTDTFNNGNEVGTGLKENGRTQSFCHLVYAQKNIERLLANLVRCELLTRADSINYRKTYLDTSDSVTNYRKIATSDCDSTDDPDQFKNCYKSRIDQLFINVAPSKLSVQASTETELTGFENVSGWKNEKSGMYEIPKVCGSTANTNSNNTQTTNPNWMLSGLFIVELFKRKKKVKNKKMKSFQSILIVALLITSLEARATSWGEYDYKDKQTCSATCSNGITLPCADSCESIYNNKYKRNKRKAYDWLYDASIASAGQSVINYKIYNGKAKKGWKNYKDCLSEQINTVQTVACMQNGDSDYNIQPNQGSVSDLTNDGFNSTQAIAELTGNADSVLTTADSNNKNPEIGVSSSSATDNGLTKSKKDDKPKSQSAFKAVGSNVNLGNPNAAGSTSSSFATKFKSMFGQDSDKPNSEGTADTKSLSQADSIEFSSANKNAQGSLMSASALNGAELDANAMGGAVALELGARAPGSLAGEEGLDDYLNRVGSLSLFERIHPHNIKHGKAVLLDNVRAQFQKMRR